MVPQPRQSRSWQSQPGVNAAYVHLRDEATAQPASNHNIHSPLHHHRALHRHRRHPPRSLQQRNRHSRRYCWSASSRWQVQNAPLDMGARGLAPTPAPPASYQHHQHHTGTSTAQIETTCSDAVGYGLVPKPILSSCQDAILKAMLFTCAVAPIEG